MPLAAYSYVERQAGFENCPLKKRPFRFVYDDDDHLEPENLSVKKFRDSDEENVAMVPEDLRVAVKREAESVTPSMASLPPPVPPKPVFYAPYQPPRYYSPEVAPSERLAEPEPLERLSLLRHPTFDFYKRIYENPSAAPVLVRNEVPRATPSGTYDGFHSVSYLSRTASNIPYASPLESSSPPAFVSPGRPESAFTPFSTSGDSCYASSVESGDELLHSPSQTVIYEAGKENSANHHTCDICRKSYATFAGLAKHKQFHCGVAEGKQVDEPAKNFTCKFCEKAYVSLGALKMHIRTHTLPCKCHLCGKAFSRPWLLQGHLRTHTGEKPFSCNQCGRSFADRSNLRAHMQTHEEVKKYSCDFCGKTFSRMSLLNKHLDGGCHVKQSSS